LIGFKEIDKISDNFFWEIRKHEKVMVSGGDLDLLHPFLQQRREQQR
jgi:hypothetical protein